jgi:ABC-type transporter Mla MlaB component
MPSEVRIRVPAPVDSAALALVLDVLEKCARRPIVNTQNG